VFGGDGGRRWYDFFAELLWPNSLVKSVPKFLLFYFRRDRGFCLLMLMMFSLHFMKSIRMTLGDLFWNLVKWRLLWNERI
jgi:hypothetical protein